MNNAGVSSLPQRPIIIAGAIGQSRPAQQQKEQTLAERINEKASDSFLQSSLYCAGLGAAAMTFVGLPVTILLNAPSYLKVSDTPVVTPSAFGLTFGLALTAGALYGIAKRISFLQNKNS